MFGCGYGGNIIFNPVFTASHKQKPLGFALLEKGDRVTTDWRCCH